MSSQRLLDPDSSAALLPRRIRRSLALLIDSGREHRLHPALVLVGQFQVPAEVVLDLTWPELCLSLHPGHTDSHGLTLDPPMSQLLHWHGCRQRYDRWFAGPEWRPGLNVFVDEFGYHYGGERADEFVAALATGLGLPALTLSALRHPCWTA